MNSEIPETLKTDSASKNKQGSTPATPDIKKEDLLLESARGDNPVKPVKIKKMAEKCPKSMIKPRKILPNLK